MTADTGVLGGGQAGPIILGVTVAAGLAAAGIWLTLAGPARRAVLALVHRHSRHYGSR